MSTMEENNSSINLAVKEVYEEGTVSNYVLIKEADSQMSEEEFNICTPILINKLKGDGITSEDIKMLEEAGYTTVESLAYSSKKWLLEIEGISEAKADLLLSEASKLVPIGFVMASYFHQIRTKMVRFTTGSKELDKLLGGGIETGLITEIFGRFNTGKTMLCHTLAVTCQMSVLQSGGEGKCIYIDTEDTFQTEHMFNMCDRFGLADNVVLDNVVFAHTYSMDHLLTLLVQQAPAVMAQSRCALLIVDSASALYRTNNSAGSSLLDLQKNHQKLMRVLLRLADEFGVAVVLTYHVGEDELYNSGGTYVMNRLGGHIAEDVSTTKIFLMKGPGNKHICKMYNSGLTEAVFTVGAEGIDDAQEEII